MTGRREFLSGLDIVQKEKSSIGLLTDLGYVEGIIFGALLIDGIWIELDEPNLDGNWTKSVAPPIECCRLICRNTTTTYYGGLIRGYVFEGA